MDGLCNAAAVPGGCLLLLQCAKGGRMFGAAAFPGGRCEDYEGNPTPLFQWLCLLLLQCAKGRGACLELLLSKEAGCIRGRIFGGSSTRHTSMKKSRTPVSTIAMQPRGTGGQTLANKKSKQ
eukprot:1161923-Pelagomonas_calceolata.AAC.19